MIAICSKKKKFFTEEKKEEEQVEIFVKLYCYIQHMHFKETSFIAQISAKIERYDYEMLFAKT